MTNSTFPDADFDRHGAPRDVPAADWPVRRTASYTRMQRGLAASLVPYTSTEDHADDRRTFLENVVARIHHDLLTGEF